MTAFLRADPSRRIDVRFGSAGEQLAGHLYRPPGADPGDRTPAVALCGPISSVKEQTLPHYAERVADAGYTALAFDPRGFGDSTGGRGPATTRTRVIEDFLSAVSYLLSRDDVDPQRVAVVGICMGGVYAVSLAARDKRIRAVVAVAVGYDIGSTFQQAFGVEGFADYLRQINDLVQQQYEDGKVRYVPTIAHALDRQTPIAAMPNDEAYEYYDRTSGEEAPNWPREITADSLPTYFAYNAVSAAPLVAPIPLLIVHGDNGRRAAAGVRPAGLRCRRRRQGPRLDRDRQPRRALRPRALRARSRPPRRCVARPARDHMTGRGASALVS